MDYRSGRRGSRHRAQGLQQLGLRCRRLPVQAPGETDLADDAACRVRQRDELAGRELMMSLLRRKEHRAIATQEQRAGRDERVAFDDRRRQGLRGAPEEAVEVAAQG